SGWSRARASARAGPAGRETARAALRKAVRMASSVADESAGPGKPAGRPALRASRSAAGSFLGLVLVEDLDGRVLFALRGREQPQPAAVGVEEGYQVFQGAQLDQPLVFPGPGGRLRAADGPRARRLPRHRPLRGPAYQELHRLTLPRSRRTWT